MLHLMKYRLIQMLREKTTMFWSLCFPLILATLFYFSFGQGAFYEQFEKIPAALVEGSGSESAKAFTSFLEEMDGDIIKLEKMTEEDAKKALSEGKIEGIYYDSATLSVGTNGTYPSILESLLDSYLKNEAMLKNIMQEHPERMQDAVEALGHYESTTEEVSAGGRTLDTSLSFFFALVAMSCLYGCFPGIQCMMETRANLSALGARQCVTPTHKLKRILANTLVTYMIQFLNVGVTLFFIKYVLRMDFSANMGGMLLVALLGSMIGVSIGIVVGSMRVVEGMKIGIVLAVSMICCFMGGLMSPDIKVMIEQNAGILNRVNPAAVIADAFYCLNVYNDTARYTQCLTTLGVMSAILVIISFLLVRRERYDSI